MEESKAEQPNRNEEHFETESEQQHPRVVQQTPKDYIEISDIAQMHSQAQQQSRSLTQQNSYEAHVQPGTSNQTFENRQTSNPSITIDPNDPSNPTNPSRQSNDRTNFNVDPHMQRISIVNQASNTTSSNNLGPAGQSLQQLVPGVLTPVNGEYRTLTAFQSEGEPLNQTPTPYDQIINIMNVESREIALQQQSLQVPAAQPEALDEEQRPDNAQYGSDDENLNSNEMTIGQLAKRKIKRNKRAKNLRKSQFSSKANSNQASPRTRQLNKSEKKLQQVDLAYLQSQKKANVPTTRVVSNPKRLADESTDSMMQQYYDPKASNRRDLQSIATTQDLPIFDLNIMANRSKVNDSENGVLQRISSEERLERLKASIQKNNEKYSHKPHKQDIESKTKYFSEFRAESMQRIQNQMEDRRRKMALLNQKINTNLDSSRQNSPHKEPKQSRDKSAPYNSKSRTKQTNLINSRNSRNQKSSKDQIPKGEDTRDPSRNLVQVVTKSGQSGTLNKVKNGIIVSGAQVIQYDIDGESRVSESDKDGSTMDKRIADDIQKPINTIEDNSIEHIEEGTPLSAAVTPRDEIESTKLDKHKTQTLLSKQNSPKNSAASKHGGKFARTGSISLGMSAMQPSSNDSEDENDNSEFSSDEEADMQNRAQQNTSRLDRKGTVALDADRKKPQRKFTVNQVRKEFTYVSKAEKQLQTQLAITNLKQNVEKEFEGREFPFTTGFVYSQCVSHPSKAESFYTVQPIYLNKDIGDQDSDQSISMIEDEMMDVKQDDFVYFGLEPHTDSNSILNKKFKMESLQSQKLRSQSSGISNGVGGPLFDYAKINRIKPDFDLNVIAKGKEFAAIALWSQEQAPGQKDDATNGGFSSCRPFYASNILSRSINDTRAFKQSLFVSKGSKKIFYFNLNDFGYVQLNIIQDGKKSFKSGHESSTNVVEYVIPAKSTLERQLVYQITQHGNDGQKLERELRDPQIVQLGSESYLAMSLVLIHMKPSIGLFKLIETPSQKSKFPIVSGAPDKVIEGAEMIVSVQDKTHLYFITNKAMTSSEDTDQGTCRLRSPTQIKRFSVKQFAQIDQMSNLSEKLAFNETLPSWDLSGPIPTMNALRTGTIGFFPYMEPYMTSDTKELTLLFFGSQTQDNITLTFNLKEASNNADNSNENTQKSRNFSGKYLNLERDYVDINLNVKGKSMQAHQFRGKKQLGTISIERIDIQEAWIIHHEIQNGFTEQSFSITDFKLDKSGKLAYGKGVILGVDIPVTFRPMEISKALQEQQNVGYPGEKLIKMELYNEEQAYVATFEGYLSDDLLNSQLLGVFTDTNDLDQMVSKNVAFRKVTQSQLQFKMPGEENTLSFRVNIQGGTMLSLKSDLLELTDLGQSDFNLIQNVHKVIQNQDGVHVLSGSMGQLQHNLARNFDDQEVYLSLTSVSQSAALIQNCQPRKLRVPAKGILSRLDQDFGPLKEQGLIQEMTLSSEFSVIMTTIHTSQFEQFPSIKFFITKLTTHVIEDDEEQPIEKTTLRSSLPQSMITNYPLIAYKNYNSDNSELVIGNFARKEAQSLILNLVDWTFLCFVGFPSLKGIKSSRTQNPLDSHIYVLVKHRELDKVKVLMIEINPWSQTKATDQQLKVFMLLCQDINLPPDIKFEELKKAECLIGHESEQQQRNLVILLQTETDIIAVPLQTEGGQASDNMITGQKQEAHSVFAQSEDQMLQRYMIRSVINESHVICAAMQGNIHKIVKVEQLQDQPGRVEAKDLFVLQAGQIAGLEIDQENGKHFYVVDDYQQILRMSDQKEGKSVVDLKQSVAIHMLEEELQEKARLPWVTMSITQRVLKIQNYCFSLNTNFLWKDTDDPSQTLIVEQSFADAMYILQVWRRNDNSYHFKCKPLPGSNVIDLVGQKRAMFRHNMYFAQDGMILVNFHDSNPLTFNQRGYIMDQRLFNLKRPVSIVAESIPSSLYGKFFLMRDQKQQNNLVQVKNGTFRKQMGVFTFDRLYSILQEKDFHVNLAPILQGLLEEDAMMISDSLMIHAQQIMVSKTGVTVLIASAILESDLFDSSQSIFESAEKVVDGENFGIDNHSKYNNAQRLFGFYNFESVLVVLFLTKTRQLQMQLGEAINGDKEFNQSHQRNISQDSVKIDNKNLPRKSVVSQLTISTKRQTTFEKSKGLTRNFTFAIIHSKLVWLSYDQREIWHIELDDVVEAGDGRIQWRQINCKGFTVHEVMESLSREDILVKGVSLNEIGETSSLRMKKLERVDQSMSLLQLTVIDNAIVYDLQPENKVEVAMIEQMSQWTDPVKFSMTGFNCQTKNKTLVVNRDQSLGFMKQEKNSTACHGLVRSFCEIDFQQIQFIQDQIKTKQALSKYDLKEIEPMTVECLFEGETVFSLFSEQDDVYEKIYDQVEDFGNDRDRKLLRDDLNGGVPQYMRQLGFVILKPTTVSVQENQYLTQLPMLKQCLLFGDIKASVLIYKLAKFIPFISFEDYITCQEDLELIIERLPAQQYLSILEKFGENFRSRTITEAILDRKDVYKANPTTFIQDSAVLSLNTPQLGLQRIQTDEEIRKKVKVAAMPLNWIYIGDDKITNADLFNIFRSNMEIMNSSLLLEVIFQSFWTEQQHLILKFCFLPYCVFFVSSQFYYVDAMLMDLLDATQPGAKAFECGILIRGSTTCETFYSWEAFLRSIHFTLCLHQLLLKVNQIKYQGFRVLKNNFIEGFNVVINMIIVLLVIIPTTNQIVSMYSLRVLASIVCVTNWIQMFFWLRLFDRTARYVDLIQNTVRDIWVFSSILFLLLLMFGSGVYMVQINRMEYATDNSQYLFEFDTSDNLNLFAEAILQQYKMMLGDFSTSRIRRSTQGFDDSLAFVIFIENLLATIYFLGTTFFTQITILNMLIAIMSSTFSRQTSNLSQLGKKQKLQLMAEYLNIVNTYQRYIFALCSRKKNKGKTAPGYLFIVFPEDHQDDDDAEQDESQRQMSQLKRNIDSKFKNLENLMNRQMVKDLQSLGSDTKTRLNALERDQRMRYTQLNQAVKEITKRQKVNEEEQREERETSQVELKKEINNVEKKVMNELKKISLIIQAHRIR